MMTVVTAKSSNTLSVYVWVYSSVSVTIKAGKYTYKHTSRERDKNMDSAGARYDRLKRVECNKEE
jgi:hypothetical protein